MQILIVNAGSTSLKYKLWDMPSERALATGRVERIGTNDAIYCYEHPQTNTQIRAEHLPINDYETGIARFLEDLTDVSHGALASLASLGAIGFKTVLSKGHPDAYVLDEDVLRGMEDYMTVAPAHNAPYLKAIRTFQKLAPDIPLVGAFETAFHQTIPRARRLYAIPYEWIERFGIMKMGYHGASHGYIAERTGKRGRVISCHLGGSSSICAILNGHSVDNSFGFSLQAGIPHNNRVGDLDAYVIPYLLHEGLSIEEIDRGLKSAGGLKGIGGVSGDMRDIETAMDAGDERATLSFDMFVEAVARYIGGYFVELGGLDQLVFTGGIGEHSARARRAIMEKCACLGIVPDFAQNENGAPERVISAPESAVCVRVIPAGEEIMVARIAYRMIAGNR